VNTPAVLEIGPAKELNPLISSILAATILVVIDVNITSANGIWHKLSGNIGTGFIDDGL
jgi:hypothetical protein